MSFDAPLELMGVPGSPYTRKMLAVLRYRRIPYRLIFGSQRNPIDSLPRAKVALLPTFFFPDGDGGREAVVDSTPIIRRLERDYVGRSVIPSDSMIAVLDYLLEDYADEWLTKAMFHYRWHYAADIENAGNILPLWSGGLMNAAQHASLKEAIAARQIGRLYVVGSNDATASVIEDSYRRYLRIMEEHLHNHRFTLGNRPGACDFGAFGQLTQLARFDPTPMEVTRVEAPRVAAWTDLIEDLSGVEVSEKDWVSRDAIPQTLSALLAEVGRVYVPVMLANAKALMAGAETVETEVDGKPWVQKPFPYQGKCLGWLRDEYRKLSDSDRAALDLVLRGTGCTQLFA